MTSPIDNEDINISDHAIVRYLERVHGIDMDAVRAEMMPSKAALAAARRFGLCKIKKPNCKLVIANNTIVTVTVKPK